MSEKLRVLIVDDEKYIRELLIQIIGSETHEFQMAENGQQAIALSEKNTFDLAFVDMKMPGMGGIETFHELKIIQPSLKIVIITGFPTEEKLLKETGIQILSKPFNISEIQEIASKLSH